VDDYTFAVGGRFHNVSFVDVRMNGRLLHVVHTKAHAFSMIVPQQLPFNERFLIVGGNRNGLATMEWFDLKKGIQSVRRITGGHRRGILNVAFRENSGGGLFTASMDGTVGMWDWCGRMKRCDFLDPDNGLGMCLAAELVDRDVLVAVGEAGLCRLELTPTLPVAQSYTPSPTSDEEAKDGWAMSMLLKMERSARHWFN
jgi:WD40 repeat protein